MKTKTLLLLLLLSLIAVDVMAQGVVERKKPKPTTTQQTKQKKQKPTPRSTPEEAGYDVTFSCNVSSAALYIDGNANGNASGSRFLKTGSHTIKVTANGYEEYTRQITVNRQNRTCSISLVKKKEVVQAEEAGYDVTFSCNVPSATLYIDGNANGNPSGSRFLKTGSHTIKVTANGYEEYSRQITVNRQNRTCSISLVKSAITASYQNGTLRVGDVSYKMVYVQGGTFTMGATSEQGYDAYSDEKPAHSVTLSSYYIGQTEVTQALWKAVMGNNPSNSKGDNLPVEEVSWDDCQEFVSKLNRLTGKNFRLPTEAEWEYAARGGSKSRGYKYSGSNTLGSVAWYDDNSGSTTHPVGTKSSNELGLYDMSGNVLEWCQDWKGGYSSSPQTNPKGPNSGAERVNRGGSWSIIAGFCRVSIRGNFPPSDRYCFLGLRLVLSE